MYFFQPLSVNCDTPKHSPPIYPKKHLSSRWKLILPNSLSNFFGKSLRQILTKFCLKNFHPSTYT